MHHARRIILALGLVLPLGLAACGSGSGSGAGGYGATGTTRPAAGTAAPVAAAGGTASAGATISGYAFQIGAVKAGTAFTVTNNDSVTHTFTSADGGVDAKVPAGGTAEVTFAKAGTFKVVCKIHASMQASVTVG